MTDIITLSGAYLLADYGNTISEHISIDDQQRIYVKHSVQSVDGDQISVISRHPEFPNYLMGKIKRTRTSTARGPFCVTRDGAIIYVSSRHPTSGNITIVGLATDFVPSDPVFPVPIIERVAVPLFSVNDPADYDQHWPFSDAQIAGGSPLGTIYEYVRDQLAYYSISKMLLTGQEASVLVVLSNERIAAFTTAGYLYNAFPRPMVGRSIYYMLGVPEAQYSSAYTADPAYYPGVTADVAVLSDGAICRLARYDEELVVGMFCDTTNKWYWDNAALGMDDALYTVRETPEGSLSYMPLSTFGESAIEYERKAAHIELQSEYVHFSRIAVIPAGMRLEKLDPYNGYLISSMPSSEWGSDDAWYSDPHIASMQRHNRIDIVERHSNELADDLPNWTGNFHYRVHSLSIQLSYQRSLLIERARTVRGAASALPDNLYLADMSIENSGTWPTTGLRYVWKKPDDEGDDPTGDDQPSSDLCAIVNNSRNLHHVVYNIYGTVMYRKADMQQTGWIGDVATVLTGLLGCHSPTIHELPCGQLVVYAEHPSGGFARAISTDDGDTWR